STQTVALTGTASTAPPQLPATGSPTITPTVALTLRALTGARGTVADPNNITSITYRWYRLAANATTFGTTPVVTQTNVAPTGTVSVSAAANSPLAVTTTVPAGASTVAISVFRLNSGLTRSSKTRHEASTVHVATVYRKVGKAKRYVFRLTERKLRNLAPGRYLVEVRVGASRLSLGPAKSRLVTIRHRRATSAR